MSKIALIILVAVVALIVIVVLTGMRYLRADDEEEPGEELADRTGGSGQSRDVDRVRGTIDAPSARRTARANAEIDADQAVGADADFDEDEDEDERDRGRLRGVEEGAGGRRQHVAGRSRRSRSRGPADAPAVRDGERSRADIRRAREEEPDRLSPVGASTARARSAGQSVSRRGDQPRPSRPSAYDSGGRSGHDGGPGDRSGEDGRRFGRDEVRAADAVPGRGTRARSAPGRRGDDGRSARDRRRSGGGKGGDERLPDIAPRQVRNRRSGSRDWPTGEWEQIPEDDYWAELASDKPVTDAQPDGRGSEVRARKSGERRRAATGARRRDAGPPAGTQRSAPRNGDGGHGRDRRDTAAASARYGDSGPGSAGRAGPYDDARPDQARMAADGRGGSGSWAADPTVMMPTNRMDSGSPRALPSARGPAPLDDDPLTSPSFPRVNADDSRSYRRGRAADSRPAEAGAAYARADGNDHGVRPPPSADSAPGPGGELPGREPTTRYQSGPYSSAGVGSRQETGRAFAEPGGFAMPRGQFVGDGPGGDGPGGSGYRDGRDRSDSYPVGPVGYGTPAGHYGPDSYRQQDLPPSGYAPAGYRGYASDYLGQPQGLASGSGYPVTSAVSGGAPWGGGSDASAPEPGQFSDGYYAAPYDSPVGYSPGRPARTDGQRDHTGSDPYSGYPYSGYGS